MKKTFGGNNKGFSLIEILVATTILIIIVMMMSTIFHQSSIAWDAGTRRAQGNVLGRSLLGIISRDLLSAVIDPNLDPTDTDFRSGSSMSFIMLAPSTGGVYRVLQKVSYAKVGSKATRTSAYYNEGSGKWDVNPSSSDIATNLSYGAEAFEIKPFPNNYAAGTLPDFVNIKFKLKKAAEVSSVGARSYGPNGRRNDNETSRDYDDIRSY